MLPFGAMGARLCLVGLAVTMCALPVSAQTRTFELDPQQSHVTFTLPATMHTVHGSFALKSGRIEFNPATGAAGGTIVLDATSARTGNDGRDRKMHRDILESAKYPEILFTARRLTGGLGAEGQARLTLEGMFTLHGASHPVSLACTVQSHAGEVTGDTSVVVPYVDWGLKNPSTFLLHVSEKVTVEIHAAGRVSR